MKKILLVHGWNYRLYNSFKQTDPWMERSEFFKLLEEEYSVDVVRLPGFCGTLEPKDSFWTTKDFGLWLSQYIKQSQVNYDYCIAYSFGAPVLVNALLESSLSIPCILVSSALRRADSSKSKIAHLLRHIPFKKLLVNVYLYCMSPYFTYGTAFLRASYKKIVREDSLPLCTLLAQKNPIFCIYGELDTATPYTDVLEELKKNNIETFVIPGGGHNIAKTHPEVLFKIIRSVIA